jgi:chaperonin GroES
VKGIVVGDDRGVPAINPMTGQPMLQPGPNGQAMPVWLVPPGAKQMRADRLGGHMSRQLLDEMSEWEPETDKPLHVLPIAGCVFRKTYFDPGKGRNASLMIDPRLVVISYRAKSLELVPRISEDIRYYPLEIEEMVRADTFRAPPSG